MEQWFNNGWLCMLQFGTENSDCACSEGRVRVFFYFSLLKSGNEILEPECYFIGYLFTYTLVVKDTIILCAY